MKGNSPLLLPATGEATRESDRMAGKNKEQRNLNTSHRMTPYDAKVAGTFAEVPRAEKSPPRDLTSAEMHANNYAKVDTAHLIGNLLHWVPLFRSDLNNMNSGKRGRPYAYSNALILWLMMYMSLFSADFRSTVGFARGVFEAFDIDVPSYTRFIERTMELSIDYIISKDNPLKSEYGEGILAVQCCGEVLERVRRVGIDSSGLSLSCHNMWRKKKWDSGTKDRGWLHFHVLCDVDSGEMLAYVISDSTIGDAPVLKLLVEVAAAGDHKFDKVYADGAYCSNENWIFLAREHDYELITSFKVNTAPTSNGCFARGEAAERWCSMPYDQWVKLSGYGTRWKCECTFSDFKRLFPETVTALTATGMVRDIVSRVNVFNIYKGIRARMIGTTGNGVVIG